MLLGAQLHRGTLLLLLLLNIVIKTTQFRCDDFVCANEKHPQHVRQGWSTSRHQLRYFYTNGEYPLSLTGGRTDGNGSRLCWIMYILPCFETTHGRCTVYMLVNSHTAASSTSSSEDKINWRKRTISTHPAVRRDKNIAAKHRPHRDLILTHAIR